MLQRGRAQLSAEIVQTSRAVHGQAPGLQRGRAQLSAEIQAASGELIAGRGCFNGAALN